MQSTVDPETNPSDGPAVKADGTLGRQCGAYRCRRITVAYPQRPDAGRTHRGCFRHLSRGVDRRGSDQAHRRRFSGGNRLAAPDLTPPVRSGAAPRRKARRMAPGGFGPSPIHKPIVGSGSGQLTGLRANQRKEHWT